MDFRTSPSRSLVFGRTLLGLAVLLLGIFALEHLARGAGLLFLFAFLIHWLGIYPRWICVHCPHYGRVCPSGGGKVAALLYDRSHEVEDSRLFGRRSRWGHLLGISLRALPIVALAVAVSGGGRHDPLAWTFLGLLLVVGFAEGKQYSTHTCSGCRALKECSARWTEHRRQPVDPGSPSREGLDPREYVKS